MKIPIHKEKFVQELLRQFYSPKTAENYGSCVASFLTYFNHIEHPSHITDQQFSDYLYTEFTDQNTQRANHSAIKKYFEICHNQKDKFRYIPYAKKEHRLPIIIDNSDIQKLIEVCKNVKHKAIICLKYFIIFASQFSQMILKKSHRCYIASCASCTTGLPL
jgi:site-specific recombinase XerD